VGTGWPGVVGLPVAVAGAVGVVVAVSASTVAVAGSGVGSAVVVGLPVAVAGAVGVVVAVSASTVAVAGSGVGSAVVVGEPGAKSVGVAVAGGSPRRGQSADGRSLGSGPPSCTGMSASPVAARTELRLVKGRYTQARSPGAAVAGSGTACNVAKNCITSTTARPASGSEHLVLDIPVPNVVSCHSHPIDPPKRIVPEVGGRAYRRRAQTNVSRGPCPTVLGHRTDHDLLTTCSF